MRSVCGRSRRQGHLVQTALPDKLVIDPARHVVEGNPTHLEFARCTITVGESQK